MKLITSKWGIRIFCVITLCIFDFGIAFSQVQNRVPFTLRTSQQAPGEYKGKSMYSLKGDFQMIGNANLFGNPYNETEGNGPSNMIYNKLSGELSSIVNSSSADFVLPDGIDPSCTNIVYAGLYWSGRADDSNTDEINIGTSENPRYLYKSKIKLKAPGESSYTELSSNEIYRGSINEVGMFVGYVDITNIVRQAGVGTYAVADIATRTGLSLPTGYYGGWGMIIIYENQTLKWRDITVFDGYSVIRWDRTTAGGSPIPTYGQLNVSGFRTAPTGDINIRMGMMAGEGDINISGDSFDIQVLNTSNWETLFHGGNTANNFFNSSIYTGGNPRRPNLKNNYGMDVSMFDLNNTGNRLITNNQTSTRFRFGTAQDSYVIFNITFAVDAFVPEVQAYHREVSGVLQHGTVLPGQELEFEVDIFNKGTDVIKDGKVVIDLPINMHFQSTQIDNGLGTVSWIHPLGTDPNLYSGGQIIWEIGDIRLGTTSDELISKLIYKARVTDNCAMLLSSEDNCGLEIGINGNITGKGELSNKEIGDKLVSSYESESCVGVPDFSDFSMAIAVDNAFGESCGIELVNGVLQYPVFCNIVNGEISRTDVSSIYPTGTRYYASSPTSVGYENSLIEGDFSVSNDGNKTKYYAVVPGSKPGCFMSFEVFIQGITSVPLTENVSTCLGEEPVLNNQVSEEGESQGLTLFYFEEEDTAMPMEDLPSPTEIGSHSYYVAEGIEVEGELCIGPKQKFEIAINALPEIKQNLQDFHVCFGGATEIVLGTEDTSDEYTWEYFDEETQDWLQITNTTFVNEIAVAQNKLAISQASDRIDGLKIRVLVAGDKGCTIYSEEVTIEVRRCKIPVNPVIPVKTKRTF